MRKGFDPASTIGWSVPLLMLLPFLLFVVVVTGVRGRRATSNVTAFALLLMLADAGLIGWARLRAAAPYRTAYQWINVPTSFTGAQSFQGFGIDISLRVDVAALAAVAALSLVTLGAVAWHRAAGRREPGHARMHALFALGLLGGCGVVLSSDLAALTAWWGLAGLATYLLVASRSGTEASGLTSRRALALPFLGDAALLAGIAILYSRYGQLDLDKLTYHVLRHTYGTGLGGLGVIAVLLGLAAAVRGGLFPFTGWMTGTLGAPPAVTGWVQGTWTLLPVVLLAKVLPLFVAAGPQPFRLLAYASAGAALAGIAISLADGNPLRSLTWAGSATLALLILGMGQPNALAPSLAGALAASLARPLVVAAAGAIARAARSDRLAEMGEAWARMRRTSIALAAGLAVLALAAVPKAAAGASWRIAPLVAALIVLGGAALARPYVVMAHLPLRRRRAFEPTRVREVAPLLVFTSLAWAAVAALTLVLALVPAWLSWIRGSAQPAAGLGVIPWIAAALAGPAIAAAVLILRGRAALELGARVQAAAARPLAGAALGTSRLRRAVLAVVGGVEDRGLQAGEDALGRSLSALTADGALAPAAAALALTLCVLVLVVVAGALLAPGVAR